MPEQKKTWSEISNMYNIQSRRCFHTVAGQRRSTYPPQKKQFATSQLHVCTQEFCCHFASRVMETKKTSQVAFKTTRPPLLVFCRRCFVLAAHGPLKKHPGIFTLKVKMPKCQKNIHGSVLEVYQLHQYSERSSCQRIESIYVSRGSHI